MLLSVFASKKVHKRKNDDYSEKSTQLSQFVSIIIILSILVGCGPSAAEFAGVDYTPLSQDDWLVSTPAEQGLDPEQVAQQGNWTRDLDDYNWGWGKSTVTTRDMAKFGLLYPNDGKFNGEQVIPANWVHDSLQVYSEDAWITKKLGRHLQR